MPTLTTGRFHETIHGVYFDDLDALGMLHNSRYLLLVERTVGSFWQRLNGPGASHTKHDDRFHLVRANAIEYLRPFDGIGEVRVRVWVEKLGDTSLTFGFSVLAMELDEPFATGTRVIVCVDPDSRKPTPWSAAFRATVQPYVRTP